MNTTDHSLPILLRNANGLRPHLNEFVSILHDRRVDICPLSETHLTSRSPLRVQGYVSHMTDHPDDLAHGGTAILVRKNSPITSFLPPVPTPFNPPPSLLKPSLFLYPCRQFIAPLINPSQKLSSSPTSSP
jgi:hypothetical protein